MKTIKEYIEDIKSMIRARRGAYEEFIEPQVINTAKAMWLRDKIIDELDENSLVSIEMGSNFQQKVVENPLTQRLQKQFVIIDNSLEACGINYKTKPSNLNSSGSDGMNDLKQLSEFMQSMK